MADTTTAKYGFVKPEVGASSDTWGSKWNQNNDDFDALLGAITTGGAANAYTLTSGLSLALVDGQKLLVKWSFGNTGAATLNVDATGAVALTKHGTSALVSGDLSSGDYAFVVYDSAGPRWRILGVLNTGFQPLDATLTALAAMAWSSGTQYVSLTAADTITLQTLGTAALKNTGTSGNNVPLLDGANNWSAQQTFSRAGIAANAINTTDTATVVALQVEGDRATPTANDSVAIEYRLSDSAGNQDSMGRILCLATDVTSGSEDAVFRLSLMVAGSLTPIAELTGVTLRPLANDLASLGTALLSWSDLFLASGAVINFNNGDVTITHSVDQIDFAGAANGFRFGNAVVPTANDGAAIGTTALSWSDLFLASGAVINFNNGDVTVTHSVDLLSIAGGALQAQVALSTETTGTLTAASSNKTVKATGDVTINDGVHTAEDRIEIYAGSAARSIIQDTGMTLRLDGTATTGTRTLAARGRASVYFVSNSEAIVSGIGVT